MVIVQEGDLGPDAARDELGELPATIVQDPDGRVLRIGVPGGRTGTSAVMGTWGAMGIADATVQGLRADKPAREVVQELPEPPEVLEVPVRPPRARY